MNISKEEAYEVGRIHNKLLREILEREFDKHLSNLKLNPDYNKVRWEQGYVNAIEELLDIVKK